MKFQLRARVETDDMAALRPVLGRIVGQRAGTLRSSEEGFEIEGVWVGSSARDLNRELLSELRRTVKKTRMRSEWTAGRTTEKFFDYVPKGRVER